MAFKMKGHTLPGINQRMDKSSKPDGRAKSSAMQLRPSKIDGVQVSDFEADEQERENQAKAKGMTLEQIKKQPKVTRTGGSEAKNILKNLSEKEKKSGKKSKYTQDILKKARDEQADPKNLAAEKKQMELNKANEAKRREEGKLRDKKAGPPMHKPGHKGLGSGKKVDTKAQLEKIAGPRDKSIMGTVKRGRAKQAEKLKTKRYKKLNRAGTPSNSKELMAKMSKDI